MSNIGTNAARIRANLGLSRYDLQQRTGLDCSYLAKVERGEITPLTKNVKRLADGLGVNVEDLMQPTPDAAPKWLDVQKDEPRVPCVILGNNGCYILCTKAIIAVHSADGTLYFGAHGLRPEDMKPELAFTKWLPLPEVEG